MLSHLHIQNYALIAHLDIDFESGFSVLTGETGAGKSIILGALNLVMGGRADTHAITEGEERCIIEAEFHNGKENLLIRRELSSNGRSRSFVNDELITQTELKTLANRLIDIHSQHANLLLADDTFQREVVDAIADNTSQREAYNTCYLAYTEAQDELRKTEQLAAQSRKDADYIAFRYEQLRQADLRAGEIEELQQEEYRLAHAGEIRETLRQAAFLLDSDDGDGALARIRSCRLDNADNALQDRLDSVTIELQDILHDINRLADRTEADPERLDQVQTRLDTLHSLLRKNDCNDIDQLIELRDQLALQMQRLDSFDDDIRRLRVQLNQRTDDLNRAADSLTRSRQAVRQPIADRMINDLSRLGIAHANFDVSITPLTDFTPYGRDDIRLLFAANLGQSLSPVSQVASGGEISRVMLCVKALIADTHALPTIIFDEIDTGVSGEIASRMADIMRKMSSSRQIIAITHLPQIAAQGRAHYLVFKQDTDSRTETHIRQLTPEERVREIAAMLSADTITPAALQNARALLKATAKSPNPKQTNATTC